MKKSLLLLVLMMGCVVSTYAQDDVYFVPKKSQEKAKVTTVTPSSDYSTYETLPATGNVDAYDSDDDWYVGRNQRKDVDSYNRRGNYNGSNETVVEDDVAIEDGQYTTRIIRFHSPSTIVVLSPYYWDMYDAFWYDPWYSWTWRPYSSWAWRTGWYSGWYVGWHGGWYDPWYGYAWNRWYYPHYNHWYGGFRPIHHYNDYAYRRGGTHYDRYYGGWGGRRDGHVANNSRNSSHRYNYGTGRSNNYGSYGNYGGSTNRGGIYNGNSRSRSFGGSSTYNRTTPGTTNGSINSGRSGNRSYNSGSSNSNGSSRNRSFSGSSSSSRSSSFGNSRSSSSSGSSYSGGGRSYSGGSYSGGGRSFGSGGGGRSGGRR